MSEEIPSQGLRLWIEHYEDLKGPEGHETVLPFASVSQAIQAWQEATFGDKRSGEGAAVHLCREAEELLESVRRVEKAADIFIPTVKDPWQAMKEEAADCLFMLLQLADLYGFDLEEEAMKKLEKNKQRLWHPPDAEGVIEHQKP